MRAPRRLPLGIEHSNAPNTGFNDLQYFRIVLGFTQLAKSAFGSPSSGSGTAVLYDSSVFCPCALRGHEQNTAKMRSTRANAGERKRYGRNYVTPTFFVFRLQREKTKNYHEDREREKYWQISACTS